MRWDNGTSLAVLMRSNSYPTTKVDGKTDIFICFYAKVKISMKHFKILNSKKKKNNYYTVYKASPLVGDYSLRICAKK